MGKKEELVDLKPKADKISAEHLKEMQDVINVINNIQFNIGKIEGQKHTLLHDLGISQKKVLDLQGVFSKEYGSFDINITDGTINWPKNEK
jgi:hypothetical protein|tara:strand:- start:1393 stop:1665 length:273 start_codon:yes stop_codon:yes gene_type:complete